MVGDRERAKRVQDLGWVAQRPDLLGRDQQFIVLGVHAQEILAQERVRLRCMLSLKVAQRIFKLPDPLAHFGDPVMQVLGGRENKAV